MQVDIWTVFCEMLQYAILVQFSAVIRTNEFWSPTEAWWVTFAV
jgi:hypothetical protein